MVGNTPTCVGKTKKKVSEKLRFPETPPRAWGRRTSVDRHNGGKGNTPTCVGKTALACLLCTGRKKHPHVRGEDRIHREKRERQRETPPRAWGRQSLARLDAIRTRNTPTCVGKTGQKLRTSISTWKHPHVRGEDCFSCGSHSSPRRNTPTCVGKTPFHTSQHLKKKKHPHVRGEDHLRIGFISKSPETPPRAWGRPSFLVAFCLQ